MDKFIMSSYAKIFQARICRQIRKQFSMCTMSQVFYCLVTLILSSKSYNSSNVKHVASVLDVRCTFNSISKHCSLDLIQIANAACLSAAHALLQPESSCAARDRCRLSDLYIYILSSHNIYKA